MQKQTLAVMLFVATRLCSLAAPLPNTEPLNADGDLSAQMVSGISQFLDAETERTAKERTKFWKRDFSSPPGYEQSISTNRQKLREIIGATEKRVEFAEIEFTSTSGRESKIAENERYAVYTVRWPVLLGISGE